MKTGILIAVVSCAAAAHAAYLDNDVSLDQFYTKQRHQQFRFYDENTLITDPHGWVSRFGVLNGGTFFNTDLQSLAPTTTADVSWDFTSIFTNFQLRFVVVYGFNEEISVFHVRGRGPTGEGVVTLPTDIGSIAFFGTANLATTPEGAATIVLFTLALLTIALFNLCWTR